MTPDDFDDDFDPTDESDPELRDLRAEVARLEAVMARQQAELDQLAAAVADGAAEVAAWRAETAELDRRITELEARQRRRERLFWVYSLIGATVGTALSQAVVVLFFP